MVNFLFGAAVGYIFKDDIKKVFSRKAKKQKKKFFDKAEQKGKKIVNGIRKRCSKIKK